MHTLLKRWTITAWLAPACYSTSDSSSPTLPTAPELPARPCIRARAISHANDTLKRPPPRPSCAPRAVRTGHSPSSLLALSLSISPNAEPGVARSSCRAAPRPPAAERRAPRRGAGRACLPKRVTFDRSGQTFQPGTYLGDADLQHAAVAKDQHAVARQDLQRGACHGPRGAPHNAEPHGTRGRFRDECPRPGTL